MMMTSAGSAGPLMMMLVLTLILLANSQQTAASSCVDTSDVFLNVSETSTNSINIKTVKNATHVSLGASDIAEDFNISDYFTASIFEDSILLAPSDLSGIADYPDDKIYGEGVCSVECKSGTDSFPIHVTIMDENTATPQLSQPSYSVEVVENYPLGLPIAGLLINASDFDHDLNNYQLTFSVDDDGTFGLSPAVLVSPWPATYSTQLMLKQRLDWSQNSEYKLTVTATDPGGLSDTSDVIITVNDVDNQVPVFKYSGYTVNDLDPTVLGPLVVEPNNISATDPDIGGPLQYTLADVPGGNWAHYFRLDQNSGALSLAKEIPIEEDTPTGISFVVEAKETAGENFTSRAVLAVYLAQQGPPPSPPVDGGSDAGYIATVVVLAVALVAVLVVLVVVIMRKRQPPAPPPQDFRGNDLESPSATHQGASGDQHTPKLPPRRYSPPFARPPRRSSPPPARPPVDQNRSYREPDQTSGNPKTGQPINSSHVKRAPPIGVTTQSAPPISVGAKPAPPISARAKPVPPIRTRAGATEDERQRKEIPRAKEWDKKEARVPGKIGATEENDSGSDSDSML